MVATKDILLGKLRTGTGMSGREQFKLTLLLAFPSIMAQLSMCLMSYIDAAMVGRLGPGFWAASAMPTAPASACRSPTAAAPGISAARA